MTDQAPRPEPIPPGLAGPDDAQARYWAHEGGADWVRDEVVHAAMLAPFDGVLVGALSLAAGERVLEVGCGVGATAEVLAATGAVVHGVDISPAMIQRARDREVGAGATFAVADAQADDLGGPFDAVASRFGVMFFADPVRAFANLASATRSGGRLAFVCWQGVEHNPWMGRPIAAVRSRLVEPPAPIAPGPGPFAFADAAYVEGVLAGAGWSDVTITPCPTTVGLGGGGGVAGAVQQVLGIGVVKALLEPAPGPVRAEVAAALAGEFSGCVVDGVVTFPAAAWLVTARR